MSAPAANPGKSDRSGQRRPFAFASLSRNVWLLLAQTLAVFIGIGVQALTMNLYLVALGYREDFLGLVAFANTAAIGAAALPASACSNRYGPRRCLIVATVGLGLAASIVAVWSAPLIIVLAMIGVGVCQAFIFVPMAPYLMDNATDADGVPNHERAFAVSFAVLSVGSVLGSALGGALPGLVAGSSEPGAEGYRFALLCGAALSALGAIALLLASDSPPRSPSIERRARGVERDEEVLNPGPRPALHAPRSTEVRRGEVLIMSVAVALLAASTGLVVPFFNVYLHDVTGATPEAVGVVYAAGAAAMAPASLAGPSVGRRVGVVRLIALARLAAVPVMLLPLLATSFGAGFVAYVLRAALVSLTQPLDNAFALSRAPDYLRARVAAIRTVSWNAGWAGASVGAGLVIVRWGYAPVFAMAAVCLLLCVVVHYVAFASPSGQTADAAPASPDAPEPASSPAP